MAAAIMAKSSYLAAYVSSLGMWQYNGGVNRK